MPRICRGEAASALGRAALTALFLLLLPATPALAMEAGDGQEDSAYAGSFSLVFEPAKSAGLAPFEKLFRESKLFDDTVDELNETLALPADLEIVFAECGVINAFYDPQKTRMVLCYELMQLFQRRFEQSYESREAATQAVVDATVFIFHHELGHALVHLLELPITGKEEDAVDDLATLVLLHEWEGGDESALNAAQAFYEIGEMEEAASENADEDAIEALPYYDEHSLGKQRYYQIACIVYGSDPQTHGDLVGEDLPEERARRCPAEYQQKSTSWGTLLADYYAAADEEEDAQE